MQIVRGPSGFGDAIYMRAIMEWLIINKPNDYTILTKFPDVFYDLPIQTQKWDHRTKSDYYFTYIYDKTSKNTQFQDMIYKENLPNITLNSKLKRYYPREETLIIPPYPPMNSCQTSSPMMPTNTEFYQFIHNYKNHLFIEKHYKFSELVYLFNSAKLIISQVGWAVPLAEMLDIPIIAILTKRALNSSNTFISTILPHKIKEKPTTQIYIME